jgi:protein SCO1/2
MDREFAETQKAVQADPALKGRVHLVTITFDPEHDTPAVLKTFANGLSADPAVWTFLTGKPETVAHVAERFGVSVLRDPSQAITHTLRTEVADRQGRITTIYTGNEWTVPQLVDALKHALEQ